MIYQQRSRNLWLSRFIATSFVATVVFILYATVVLIFGGDAFWFALVIAITLAVMVIGYLRGDRWILNRFTDQFITPPHHVRELLEEMAIAAGIPTPVLYVIDTGTLNAFAVGREPSVGVVVVTKGLTETLDHDELRAVFAHEVAHIRDGDSTTGGLIALVAWTGYRLFIVSWYALFSLMRAPALVSEFPVLALVPLASFALPLGGRLAQMAFSRSREYLADNSAVLLTRDPEGLIGALTKMQQRSNVVLKAGLATSHLFAAPPESIWNTEVFTTHPAIEDRIERLRHVTAVPVDAHAH